MAKENEFNEEIYIFIYAYLNMLNFGYGISIML